ncbi:hypothetical protein A3K02_01700 [candidate division WS6 bacterium RIFOXYD1_FULL_33_8]|uniref:Peptidyl-prolyl cis-trans isomerase n=2 Tax=Candidatus Dojkabacteria TaxID=74243 RepID=A0A0G0CT68_9BACT|nr:MAG: FKBP-type peptidyl-prolyl cis-trans isomerase, peptidylprolyl isomerase [candidate division WS6 bacterium GW2011_GWE2_33_157]KKP43571.1 MAG: FKBP-type peptidyl-prolyl cis-trans isomerase, peptidylprolyl isomerase [candidate division WS6 bacterium GW2011_GWC1_33_20]KKP45589.1 MAG: FKBP-type peptidyl-prolyl cis-trans isomerase, peptidylprolyl isomerase [candidate division WS6 bacterium GW2011_GWF1_33_233]KKP54360.1 MAG: Peptidyl-prolyl cis-trans isomerase [candidate division WS6 bacterium 
MSVPQGAKFLFVIVPIFIAATILLVVIYVGNDKDNLNLTEEDMNNITTNGSVTNPVEDFDELGIEIVKEGSGLEAVVGDTVVVNYEGKLTDGTKFDSSFDRGTPFEFTLGENRVIQGWEEGVKGMKVGEERELKIPSSMGYGDYGVGSIPPKAGLIFKVVLVEIR